MLGDRAMVLDVGGAVEQSGQDGQGSSESRRSDSAQAAGRAGLSGELHSVAARPRTAPRQPRRPYQLNPKIVRISDKHKGDN